MTVCVLKSINVTKTYMKKSIIILTLMGTGMLSVFAQGFLNFGFENANVSGNSPGSVAAANAIPDWTAYLGGTAQANINYDVSLVSGGFQVDLLDANSGQSIIQGNYEIALEGSASESASIGQTGTIPVTAQSLIWSGSGPDSLSFNSQELPISILGYSGNYTIYGANISALAGETGQLLFTSSSFPAAPVNIIDNIQFSSSPVPEPNILSLSALGGLFLVLRKRKVRAI